MSSRYRIGGFLWLLFIVGIIAMFFVGNILVNKWVHSPDCPNEKQLLIENAVLQHELDKCLGQ